MTLRDAIVQALGLTGGTGTTASSAMTVALDTLEAASGGSQNVFSVIEVNGQNNVVADMAGDTLTIAAGSGITLTTDDSTDTITISSTGGGSFHLHVQNTASTTWTINHNLGYRPVIATIDTSNDVFMSKVSHPTVNQAVVTLNSALDGIARCV